MFFSLVGEFQLRLRQLEKSLLQALNEVKGRILDDDTIITTLENLKKEAAEVTRKVEETDIVMAEVETVSQQYLTLSSACSSIYFTMEALNQVWTQPCSPSKAFLNRQNKPGIFVSFNMKHINRLHYFPPDALPLPVLPSLFLGYIPHCAL